jgi:hypothetical protein
MRWIDSRRSGRRQRRKMVDVSARPTVGGMGPLVLPVPPAASTSLMAFAAYVPGPND